MDSITFSHVGESTSFTSSTLPAYTEVLEYVNQNMSRGRQYDYCAGTGYDTSNLRSGDYAAVVAYHLSMLISAYYRDYAVGARTERQMRANIDRLVLGWAPSLEVLAQGAEAGL